MHVKTKTDRSDVCKPREAWITLKSPEARRGPWNRLSFRASLSTPWFLTSGLHSCERIHFCCSCYLVWSIYYGSPKTLICPMWIYTNVGWERTPPTQAHTAHLHPVYSRSAGESFEQVISHFWTLFSEELANLCMRTQTWVVALDCFERSPNQLWVSSIRILEALKQPLENPFTQQFLFKLCSFLCSNFRVPVFLWT